MSNSKMTKLEWRSVISLSSVMALRMIGLFMVLPVFSIYAQKLSGSTALLVGLALGIYGLTQAICQIPFGHLSDRYGRKPIIFAGLMIFILGSFLAAITHSIYWMILARALQGAGAVGSTILAMMADLTRDEHRTKSMAIAGISIGSSFAIAMILGPLLLQWFLVNQLFYLAVCFGLIALGIIWSLPTPPHLIWQRDAEPELKAFFKLLKEPELAKLNFGIFILHAIFTASFIAIPTSLQTFTVFLPKDQWKIYLPTLLIAFFISLILIGLAERQKKLKTYFLLGIFLLSCSECLFIQSASSSMIALSLGLFFTGFSLLEAFLPSLVSRTAPAARKGTALGIYSSAQFLGIFVGGLLGGWIYGQYQVFGVYVFCLTLSTLWIILASLMRAPRFLIAHRLSLSRLQPNDWHKLASRLHKIPGIVDVAFIADENMAYLKMENKTLLHPDFIHLKEELQ